MENLNLWLPILLGAPLLVGGLVFRINTILMLEFDKVEKSINATNIKKIDLTDEESMKKEWYDLSWSGKNPVRVVALAHGITWYLNEFEGKKLMASSFYSQVKYLAKRWRILWTVYFFIQAWKARAEALLLYDKVPKEKRSPIDLEVLGSPDYLLVQIIPFFGPILFGHRAREFLETADQELADQPINNPLESAIIWSKLWSLTKNDYYRRKVGAAGLHDGMDKGQLLRVATHLGFQNLDELYVICKITTRSI